MTDDDREKGLSQATALLLFFGSFFAVVALAWWGSLPPAPLPKDAPKDEFSAHRTVEIVQRLFDGPEYIHWVGTPENAKIRDRLIKEFQALGLETTVQKERVCSSRHCAVVHNILVKKKGETLDGKQAVFVSAHYDSVASSPGVADDLANAAALVEVARALHEVETKNPIVYLITDGEEMGLFGADAFWMHPWSHNVGMLINLEARGTRGRSFVFETGTDANLIVQAGAKLSAPAINSLAPAVYERLPNASDLHVHKSHGVQGLNLGFFAELSHYHTHLDDLEHLSLRSLQHQGQNALELARTFGQMDLSQPSPSRVVSFDVLGTWLVRWPESFSLPLAILAIVMVLGTGVVYWRRERFTLKALLGSTVWFIAVLALTGLAGVLFDQLLVAIKQHPMPWRGAREVAVWMYTLLTFGLFLGLSTFVKRWEPHVIWVSGWSLLGVLGVLSAWGLEAVSYIWVAPVFVAGVLGLVSAVLNEEALDRVLWLLAGLIGCLVWFPLCWTLIDGLELMSPLLVTTLCSFIAVGLVGNTVEWSVQQRRGVVSLLGVLTLVFVIIVAMSPRALDERPEALNILSTQLEGQGSAKHYLYMTPMDLLRRKGDVPSSFGEVKKAAPGPVLGGFRNGELPFLETKLIQGAKAPKVEYVGSAPSSFGGRDRVAHVVRIISQRGSSTLSLKPDLGEVLWLPESTRSMSDTALLAHLRTNKNAKIGNKEPCLGFKQGHCHIIPSTGVIFGAGGPEGMRVLIVEDANIKAGETRDVFVRDIAVGLPKEADEVKSKRPSWAVPTHIGDLTIVGGRRTFRVR